MRLAPPLCPCCRKRGWSFWWPFFLAVLSLPHFANGGPAAAQHVEDVPAATQSVEGAPAAAQHVDDVPAAVQHEKGAPAAAQRAHSAARNTVEPVLVAHDAVELVTAHDTVELVVPCHDAVELLTAHDTRELVTARAHNEVEGAHDAQKQ